MNDPKNDPILLLLVSVSWKRLVVGCLIGLALLPVALTGQSSRPGSPIAVGPNVHVSDAFAEHTHAEVIAVADPDDARRLIVCSMATYDGRLHVTPETDVFLSHFTTQHCYASFDRGQRWSPTLVLDEDQNADPAASFGRGDTVFVATMLTDPIPSRHIRIFRSPDGGQAWQESAKLPLIDREWMVVDRTGGVYDGRVYVSGMGPLLATKDNPDGIEWGAWQLYRSLDGGATFLALEPPSWAIDGASNIVVLSDGAVGVVGIRLRKGRSRDLEENNPDESANAVLEFFHSTDGGRTLERAGEVSDFYMDRPRSEGAINPPLAVDATEGPFKDRLYTVWADARHGRLQVFLSYSADKGKTWSRPLIVNDDRAVTNRDDGPDHTLPMVAVNRHGVVAVSWYDRRDSPDNLGWTVRIAASFDGGETFTASVPVSSEPHTSIRGGSPPVVPWTSRDSVNAVLHMGLRFHGFFLSGGHTTGLTASADGVFHPVWVDNRTGVDQVWTAAVTVEGEAVKHGSRDLAELENISSKVMLVLTDRSYDPSTERLTLTARLENTSQDTIVGPLKVRAVRVASERGTPQIVNADDQQATGVAIWDFTALLPDNMLPPGAHSGTKAFQVVLTDVRPPRGGRDFQDDLVSVEAQVFGSSRASGAGGVP